MKYKTRATRVENLPSCLELLSDRHLYATKEGDQLIRFWSELITTGCAYSGIAVDSSKDEIVAFSVTICISERFAQHIHSGRSPYIGRHIFSRWLTKERFYLSDREIGEYNASSGVNVLTIHSGYRPFSSVEEYADLRRTLIQVFMEEHKGLHIRSFAHELYGEYQEPVRTSGIRVHEYDSQLHPQLLCEDPQRRPYLTTLCINGAAGQRGNYLSDTMAFSFTTPRFCFTATQRQLLRTALENDTDEYASKRLHLSPPAIKKRWSSIYEKIAEIDPTLLGKDSDRLSGRRGPEFRRQVLAYLRDHPEELHPFVQSPNLM